MIDHVLICSCGEVLIKSTSAETKMRSKILIFRNGQAFAVCKGCGAERSVPIRLDRTELLIKSRNPRLFVKNTQSK